MVAQQHVTRGRRVRRACLVVAGIVVGVVVLAVAVALILPSAVWSNLSSESTPVDTVVAVPSGAADADAPVRLTVPAGWVRQHPPLQSHTLVLLSPDGALEVTLRTDDEAAAAAFTASAGDAGPSPVTETLRSGLRAVHAVTDDGGTLVAAVGDGDSGPALVATAPMRDGDLADYVPTIAGLLDGVRIS